jgi:hypothetical protein
VQALVIREGGAGLVEAGDDLPALCFTQQGQLTQGRAGRIQRGAQHHAEVFNKTLGALGVEEFGVEAQRQLHGAGAPGRHQMQLEGGSGKDQFFDRSRAGIAVLEQGLDQRWQCRASRHAHIAQQHVKRHAAALPGIMEPCADLFLQHIKAKSGVHRKAQGQPVFLGLQVRRCRGQTLQAHVPANDQVILRGVAGQHGAVHRQQQGLQLLRALRIGQGGQAGCKRRGHIRVHTSRSKSALGGPAAHRRQLQHRQRRLQGCLPPSALGVEVVSL